MEKLLAIEDICEMLDVCKRTAWRYVKEGYIPEPLRIGNKRSKKKLCRWKREEIEKWISGGCQNVKRSN